MSRHALTALPECQGYEIAVGWDPPLSTFFAYVGYVDDERADLYGEVLWIGTRPGEITDHARVINAVRHYAHIPDDLGARLYGEAHG